jgi:hypothetical protein
MQYKTLATLSRRLGGIKASYGLSPLGGKKILSDFIFFTRTPAEGRLLRKKRSGKRFR